MDKEKYYSPQMEVIKLSNDIICTSGEDGDNDVEDWS